jgi:RNA polymerase sigma factor (sigma-70 family)
MTVALNEPEAKTETETARATAMAIVKTGSDPSFEALFATHLARVYSLLFRLVGSREEAEDLALDVFLRLHRQPPRDAAESRHRLAGWLCRVASNLGLNALRAEKRRRRYEEAAERSRGATAQAGPATDQDPATALERAGTRRQVRLVLAAIKPRSARLLVLRHSGLSYAELAEAPPLSGRATIPGLQLPVEATLARGAFPPGRRHCRPPISPGRDRRGRGVMAVLTIARLTFHEALRRRILLAALDFSGSPSF